MNAQRISGTFDGRGLRIALVVARFNEVVTARLESGALEALQRMGTDLTCCKVVEVPGAFEIPCVAARATKSGNFDAVICLAAVIRGETPHFDMVVSAVTSGVAKLSLESGVPVIYGVLTTDTVEQAMDRAGLKSGNKGAEAAMTAVEMVRVLQVLG